MKLAGQEESFQDLEKRQGRDGLKKRERALCFRCTELEMTAKAVSARHALILPYKGNFWGKRGLE